MSLPGLTYDSDDVIQLGTPLDGGTSSVFGGTATNETIDGGDGNAIIFVGNSANALIDLDGGNKTVTGGTGSDHFVVDFSQQVQDTIIANSAGTNLLEVDGGGGGEDIDVEPSGGLINISSVLGGVQDSVLAANMTVLDIEPAPGVNSTGLTEPGPAPSTSPITVTIGDLNGTGLQTLYIDMLGTTSQGQQVCPINSTITGSGNDNVTVGATLATLDGQSTGGSSTLPPAAVYQVTSTGSDLTIFDTDGPGDTLAYNLGAGSNTVTLDNSIETGSITFNSLQDSSGTDTYNITSNAVGPVAINRDGKDVAISIGSPTAGLAPIQVPVTIGGAVADPANQDGYDGTLSLTIDDSGSLIGGPGTLDDGSFSGFDLGANTISWTFATSLDVLLGNFGNDLSVDLTQPIASVVIHGGNGGDTIDATPSLIPMALLGGWGDNTFRASNNGDYISGGGGSDKIYEGLTRADGGDDTIIGGNGQNVIVEDGAKTLIYGNGYLNNISGTAAGTIYTGPDMDTVLFTGSADETVFATGGEYSDDSITLGGGNNFVHGLDGYLTIITGNGRDTIAVGDGDDSITVGGGNDSVGGRRRRQGGRRRRQ